MKITTNNDLLIINQPERALVILVPTCVHSRFLKNKIKQNTILTKGFNQYEIKHYRSGVQAVQIAGRRERDETDLAYQKLVGRLDR